MDCDRRAPAASSVLGDDDLLREILIRLGFPNLLVRAALVSKRWLLHASDPVFLRRFRDRNPPRVLGVCAGYSARPYKFVPLPQPPELAALSRRAASSCADAFALGGQRIEHCRNGRLIVDSLRRGTFNHSVLAPLLSGEPEAVLPPIPPPGRHPGQPAQGAFTHIFLPEDGGCNGITLVNLWKVQREVRAEVYVLGAGGWGAPSTAVTEIELQYAATFFAKMLPPVHGKVFMVTGFGYTLGLDLAAARFVMLELPAGVQYNYMLSCAEGSGIYLVTADRFQLSVWLHQMTGDNHGAGGWLLVDTFSVLEACIRLAGDNWVSYEYVNVVVVGDNADFVFLDHPASGVLFYVHRSSRVVKKVYQRTADEHVCRGVAVRISPVMTTWPPIFPALSIGHDQGE
ncbi:hypothetical protein ZWY2020_027154 [Hordeum vulgare]|nr:hypothetical protein ZWY2020_027154 [Hordeum vulgare]BAJ97432.1 predicted protein [Hordeum vulgare subsp. vulgare]